MPAPLRRAISVVIVLAPTDAGAMRVVVSDTSAGLLARLLVPLGLLHPFGFDALGLSGERTRWYSTDVGVALL